MVQKVYACVSLSVCAYKYCRSGCVCVCLCRGSGGSERVEDVSGRASEHLHEAERRLRPTLLLYNTLQRSRWMQVVVKDKHTQMHIDKIHICQPPYTQMCLWGHLVPTRVVKLDHTHTLSHTHTHTHAHTHTHTHRHMHKQKHHSRYTQWKKTIWVFLHDMTMCTKHAQK